MDHRVFLNAVFWRTRTGAPWRDLPRQYGNWKTVYGRHRRWSADGTWAAILDRLRQDCDRQEGAQWTVGVDSTIVRGPGDPDAAHDRFEGDHVVAVSGGDEPGDRPAAAIRGKVDLCGQPTAGAS
jgi:transposase